MLPDPTVLLTVDGRIIAANKAFAALLGTVPDRLRKLPLAGRIGMPEPELREIIGLCSRTSGALPFTAHLWNDKGEVTPYRLQGVLLERDDAQRSATLCLRVSPHARAIRGFSNINGELIALKREVVARQKAEVALREREYFYRQTLESIPGMVFTNTPDGSCDYVNNQWVEFTGVPAAEQLGSGWTQLLHPDDREVAFAAWRNAVEGRGDYNLEYRVRRRDGAHEWFKVESRAIRDGQGSIIRWFGTAVKVDNLKQAEKALRESEERLSSILNRAPAAIFIKDSAGRYLFINEECARVLSVNREQACGHTDRDLLSSELAAQFMANDQRVWESGQLLTVEEQVPQADGVHRSLVQKFLLRDSQGQPYALSGIAFDITPHLRLEAAIQVGEARLQLAQSVANIGVFGWDIVAQKAVWSPELERICGLPAGGFDGTAEAWRRLVHPDDLASVHAGTQRSLEDPTMASEFEFRIVRTDGAVRWIYAKAKTLCNEEGRAVRMVGVILDITDRKEAQLRLERFAEELERQVASRTEELVSSEDRLRAMATDLTLSEQRERKRLANELHDHLQQMLVLGKLTIGQGKRVAAGVPACEQILKKVDDILSDALTYTRTLVSDLSPTVLRDHGLVASLQWLGGYMQKHGQTVIVTVTEAQEPTLPEGQMILLFQSARELLINSAKHAGTGQATLTMEQRDRLLRITVRDEGKGFDRAQPATAAGDTPSGGISSKYGLYSVQERMRALGGSFEVQSVRGQGTTATLVLPLGGAAAGECSMVNGQWSMAKPQEEPPPAFGSSAHSPSTIKHSPSPIRVLLVDDHIMVRQGLRAVLDVYADVELVGEAGDGEEAVRLVDQLRPAVVVMDINMPKMDGIEATARIKRGYPETIVIGLSVNAGGENQEAMRRAGAIQLMTKESAVEQLYDAIQEAVQGKQ